MRRALAGTTVVSCFATLVVAAAACAAAAWPAAAGAQQSEAEPSASARCLTPAGGQRGEPEYPFDALKANRGGRLKVELVFRYPDWAPDVVVLESEGGQEFVDAVREHVRRFRVPCLQPGEAPARLRQEYVFLPDNRAAYSTDPSDADAARWSSLTACLRHVSGARHPEYPLRARQTGAMGRVIATLRFSAPDQPPEQLLYARSPDGPLVKSVRDWVAGYRLPCLEGAPITASLTFVFLLSEGARDPAQYGFKPLTLRQWLATVRNVRQQPLKLDTTQMGCPFDLRVQYRQPHLPNRVDQLGNWRPEREPLLRWLRGTELDLPAGALDAVYGDMATVTVPCLRIDIDPSRTKE